MVNPVMEFTVDVISASIGSLKVFKVVLMGSI
jgi:hypothetical protein